MDCLTKPDDCQGWKNFFLVLLLFMVVIPLLMSSCSNRLYRDIHEEKSVSRTEAADLRSFIKSDVEKDLDTRKVTPDLIIQTARRYLGVPHCMGGTTEKCMDCSGLLYRVFLINGIKLPHNSEEQARYGKIIADEEKLKTGDLVFFTRTYNTKQFVTHSGIYTGNGRFIHVSSSRGVVITLIDDPWWRERYLFATRVFD